MATLSHVTITDDMRFNKMSRIETYVFLSFEATGDVLLHLDGDIWMPDITELSMLAVKRTALFLCKPTKEPRVQNKFQMFFNPTDIVQEEKVKSTGLNSTLLEKETKLNHKAFDAINSFLNCLEKPVCLIAHGGLLFHFPVLKYHLERMNVHLASDIKCADSLQLFFDIITKEDFMDIFGQLLLPSVKGKGSESAKINEPVGKISNGKSYWKLMRKPFYAPDDEPYEQYNLAHIYDRRVKGRKLRKKINTTEEYCYMMMKIAQTLKGFEHWVQNYHCLFSGIPIYPPKEKTWYLDDDDDSPEEKEVKDSSSGLKEAKESSEQKEDKSSSRWYNIFNYF